MASIEERVESLIQKKIEELGYELYDVQYVKEGKDYFLRVFIDKEAGIDLTDCEKVSNEIDPILDEADYIKEMYFLEVSSPGVERVLRKEKHFEQALGKKIEIKLFKPIEGQKEYIGIFQKYDDEKIYIEVENIPEKGKKNKKSKDTKQEVEKQEQSEISIERKNISLMKIKFNWE